MWFFPRLPALLLLLLVCAGGAPGAAAQASPAPLACPRAPAAALLVDGSASMADYDGDRALRRAAGRAVGGVLVGEATQVHGFAEGLLPAAEVVGGAAGIGERLELQFERADGGATALPRALAQLARRGPLPRVIVVVTDAEPAPVVRLPRALADARVVIAAVGGEPPAWMRRLARASGGEAVALTTAADGAALHAAVEAAVAAAGCAAGGAGPPGGGAAEVVLVSGLRDRAGLVRGARTARACAPAASLAAWCRTLVAGGARVWVPSIAPRGRTARGRTLLNSTGRLAGNGRALAAWAGRTVPGAPVFVGHSMGGLIAHAAITWSGAPARGLVTVGTPHSGSYAADAYLSARTAAAACVVLCPAAASGLAAGAATARLRFGPALDELTRRRRVRVARLPALGAGVPVAVYAGAVNRTPTALPGLPATLSPGAVGGASGGRRYFLPNDGIVGVGSAVADGVPLRPGTVRADGTARHSPNVLPAGAPVQLSSPDVTAFLSRAVAGFTGGAAAQHPPQRFVLGRRAGVAGAALGGVRRGPATEFPGPATRPAPGQRRAARPPRLRRISVPLAPVRPLAEFGGSGALPEPDAVVISADPVTLDCDGVAIDALPVPGPLWLLDLGALDCARVTVPTGGAWAGLESPGVAPRAVALGPEASEWSPPPRGAARLVLTRRARGAWRVEVRGVSGRPRVRTGSGQAITMRRRRGVHPPRYRGALGPRLARRAGYVSVTATVADEPSAASAELE